MYDLLKLCWFVIFLSLFFFILYDHNVEVNNLKWSTVGNNQCSQNPLVICLYELPKIGFGLLGVLKGFFLPPVDLLYF